MEKDRNARLKACMLVLLRRRMQIRTRNALTRCCLIHPDVSEWHHLYKYGTDANLINVLSIDRASFNFLLKVFTRVYPKQKAAGRKRLISSATALGILLTFYTDTCGNKTLCRMFGITPSTLSLVLKQAEQALERALLLIPEAGIYWPSKDDQRRLAEAVKRKTDGLIDGRWGFIDGKNYPVEEPTNIDLQNAMYNGWLHSVFVTGCFCFAADGTVAWGKHNFVGSWNDGETSRDFVEALINPDLSLEGHGVVADTAFPVSSACFSRIITPLKEGEIEKVPFELRGFVLQRSAAITSLRQAAEWGMGAVEKVYRRLLLKLPYNQTVRHRRLNNIYRLYNFRVRRTGISQIRSFFFDDVLNMDDDTITVN